MHHKSVEEVLELLSTSPDGISEEEAKRRLKKYGYNTLGEEKISYLRIFLNQFKSIFVYVLALAGLIAFFWVTKRMLCLYTAYCYLTLL